MTITTFNDLPNGCNLRLKNARVPSTLLEYPHKKLHSSPDGMILLDIDIDIADGRIEALHHLSEPSPADERSDNHYHSVDLDSGQVWPCFIDVHTHLDKSHISGRTLNPDGTLLAAIQAEATDQSNFWSEDDLSKRMNFALQCAYAHGTRAIRSHLCCEEAVRDKIWHVFQQLRVAWSDKIELQPVSILNVDLCEGDYGERLADFVAAQDGVLGCAILDSENPKLPAILDHLLQLAAERSLDIDFHADENGNPASHGLREIARAVLRNDFQQTVLVGHCCSLAQQNPEDINNTLDMVADSNINIVSLPLTNLYLQDRKRGTTPRWRGITCLQEMQARNIPIALASDNCRDLFNFFGDYDMHQVLANSVLCGHLDKHIENWATAVATTPSEIMQLSERATIKVGSFADLILFSARSFGELLSRPQIDRVLLRRGQLVDTAVPDYRLLDE